MRCTESELLARLISKHLSGRFISGNIWTDIKPMDAFKCGYSKTYASNFRKTLHLTQLDNLKQRKFMMKIAQKILREMNLLKRHC